MKMSCLPVCFFGPILRDKSMSREDWFRIGADLGLEGTEIYESFVGDLDAAGMAKLTGAANDVGLQVSMYSLENDFSRPDTQERAIGQVREAVDIALTLKTEIVRVTAASPFGPFAVDREWLKGTNRGEAVKSCSDGLRACLDYAEEHKVVLALEDHPDIGWSVEEFMTIIELVDDPRLKVNLDTSNVHPDTVLDLTRQVADRVVHMHVKDRQNNDHSILIGTGEVDLAGIFRILREAGFDGWLSAEAMAGDREKLEKGIKNIRDAWESA
jgi:sugar phosphate isomerase/epimerase